jgi:hypothetical protein
MPILATNHGPQNTRSRWRSILFALAPFACIIMLCSCEPELSVHKLYTSDDVIFDPALLGIWTEPDSAITHEHQQLEFRSANPGGYTINLTFQESPSAKPVSLTFAAQLVKLHGTLFIDVVPTGLQVDGQDSDALPQIPGHYFGRISFTGDVLKISFLDDDWVADHIKSRDIHIDSEEEANKLQVLTAPTADLQQLVIDHADDDQAFSVEMDDLKRQ